MNGAAIKNWNWSGALLLLGIACLTLGPVIAILVMSFDNSGIGEPFRPGLDGWASFLTEPKNLRAFLWSFILTIRVPFGLFVALVIAWLLVRVRVPGSRYFEYMFWFAYFLPAIPLVTGWILLLDKDIGLVNQWLGSTGLFDGPVFNIRSAGGIIWAHMTTQTIPILVILIAPAMRMIDRALDDAAIISGASAALTLRKIVLPLALPALLVAGTASWIKALESFEMEQVLGVPAGIYVYSNRIYDLVLSDPPRMAEAMAMSSVFLVILIGLGVVYQFLKRDRSPPPETLSEGTHSHRSAYSKTVKYIGAGFIFCFILVTIGLPFIMLLTGSFMRLFGFFALNNPWTADHWLRVLSSGDFTDASLATLKLGFSTALPGTLAFAVIAWGIIQMGQRMRAVAEILVWLPWVFPGVILGVGLLEVTLFAPVFSTLHGTTLPMVFGILIKQMPIGVHMLRVSFGLVNKDLTMAARLTGAGISTIFTKVILPLNAPVVTVVFLLIFSATITEIGVIVLIAPPDMQTLSILIFKYAVLGDFESASVVGTIVAFIALAASALAFRIANRVGLFE